MLFHRCSKRAASSLGGLAMLAAITPAMLLFCHVRASQQEPVRPQGSQGSAKPPSPAKDEEQALAEFLDTYRLAPGANLKRIPLPRPKGIRVWKGRTEPVLGAIGDLQDVRAIIFGWREQGDLRVLSSLYGSVEGWTIRELPRCLNMGLYSYEIEGDSELLKTEVGGDWIVREGVPAEQLIQPLEAILQRAIRQRITLELRRVERDVVVARGRYRPSPLQGHADGEIEIYAHELAQHDDRGGGAGVFPAFLNWTAGWIGRPIVNEVESPPTANIAWHHGRRKDRDLTLVLKHLEEQTGLTFTREKRPIRILFVERAVTSK
jgi:hypothetical protein